MPQSASNAIPRETDSQRIARAGTGPLRPKPRASAMVAPLLADPVPAPWSAGARCPSQRLLLPGAGRRPPARRARPADTRAATPVPPQGRVLGRRPSSTPALRCRSCLGARCGQRSSGSGRGPRDGGRIEAAARPSDRNSSGLGQRGGQGARNSSAPSRAGEDCTQLHKVWVGRAGARPAPMHGDENRGNNPWPAFGTWTNTGEVVWRSRLSWRACEPRGYR